jgi:hypothetical protein
MSESPFDPELIGQWFKKNKPDNTEPQKSASPSFSLRGETTSPVSLFGKTETTKANEAALQVGIGAALRSSERSRQSEYPYNPADRVISAATGQVVQNREDWEQHVDAVKKKIKAEDDFYSEDIEERGADVRATYTITSVGGEQREVVLQAKERGGEYYLKNPPSAEFPAVPKEIIINGQKFVVSGSAQGVRRTEVGQFIKYVPAQ